MEKRSKLGSLAHQKSSRVNEVDVSVKVAEKDRSRKDNFMSAPQAVRHPEAGFSEKESS